MGMSRSDRLFRSARRVARQLDRSVVHPAQLFDAAAARLQERRRRAAATDERWVGIEACRSDRFAAVDPGMWAGWETQADIERALVPDPCWVRAGRWVRRTELVPVVAAVERFWQRGHRGWSRSDVWSMKYHVLAVVADMLTALADDLTSWPGNDEFPEPELWEAALRDNAARLERRLDRDGAVAALLDEWYELEVSGDAVSADAVRRRIDVLEAERADEARTAMRWVADHLEDLWD